MIKNDDDRVVFFDVDGTLLDTSDFAETARKAAIGFANIRENSRKDMAAPKPIKAPVSG